GGDGGRGGAAGGGGGGCGGSSHAFLVVTRGADASAYAAGLLASEIEAFGVAGAGGRGGVSPTSPGGTGTQGSPDAVFVVVE
ncbi:MAG: PE family protein, partial [Myxococcota bacterium]